MKKYIITFLVSYLAFAMSCTNESLVPEPQPETAVHGWGNFQDGSAQNLVFGDPTVELDFNFQWVSIDSKNTVEKIEFYVLFDEEYFDIDGKKVTARHGGSDGLLLNTIEGAQIPTNRTDMQFSISQQQIFDIYKNSTFDYGNGAVNIWANVDKPDRDNANNKFIAGDSFSLKWILYTADGRKFDRWNDSVCLEFPGANCQMQFAVICVSNIGGVYDAVTTADSYGTIYTYNYVETYSTTDDAGKALPDGKYQIADLTGGMETDVWGNPPVKCVVVDVCGSIVLDLASFSYIYGYSILPGSVIDPVSGVITINWENVYGEFGTTVYTPQ